MSASEGYSDLTTVERRFLDAGLRRLRALEGMVLGAYAEGLVAEALPGSVEVESGTDRIDLTWHGLAVEVKSTRGVKWGVGPSHQREDGVHVRRRCADVYVLVLHAGECHLDGWTFYVVPRWRLDDHNRKEVGLGRMADWGIVPCESAALAGAVLSADLAPNSTARPGAVARRPGEQWQPVLAAPRASAGSLRVGDLPTSSGVYAWFHDGEPVHAGRAITTGGIRTQVGRHDLDTSPDLSRSSFRRNVREHLRSKSTRSSRGNPWAITVEQVVAVNDWIASCEVAWIAFDGPEDARELERLLIAEWKPPFSRR